MESYPAKEKHVFEREYYESLSQREGHDNNNWEKTVNAQMVYQVQTKQNH